MTAALARAVDGLDLAPEPGLSTRSIRTVLRVMARIANDAGDFRYGLRGSKVAALTDYSLAVVRRAQRYLVEHGYLERVAVGGGRASTRWRVLVDKLTPGHGSRTPVTRHSRRRDTAQGRRPGLSSWMLGARTPREPQPLLAGTPFRPPAEPDAPPAAPAVRAAAAQACRDALRGLGYGRDAAPPSTSSPGSGS